MAPRPALSDSALVERLADEFRRSGFEAASLGKLATVTGLQRSSLYHRFPRGKDQMAEEAVASVTSRFAEMLAPAADVDRTPAERLEEIGRGLRSFYADGTKACLLDVLSVTTINESTHAALAAALEAWVGAFASLSRASGVARAAARRRAEDAIARIEGALVVGRVAGTSTAFERAIADLPTILLAA